MTEPVDAAPSNVKGLGHLAGHLAVLGLTGAVAAFALGTPWLVPAMAVHGVVLVFLFAPLHESVHRTAFRTKKLNDAVAWIAGLILALPPNAFRAFHFAHHCHTQMPGRDPELEGKAVDNWRDYLITLSGWRYWRGEAVLLVDHARGRVTAPYYPERLKPRLIREARVFLGVYAAIAAISIGVGSSAALVFWIGPVLLGQPVLRAYLMAEHSGLPLVETMWENTRTTLTLAPVRFLAWNMPFHTEHHAHPAVPFHALPALHQAERARLKHVAPGYLAVHREHIGNL